MAINILDLELREHAHSHVKEATGGSEPSSDQGGQLGPADRVAAGSEASSSTVNDGQWSPTTTSSTDESASSTTPPDSSTAEGVGVDPTASSIDSASLTSLPSESATPTTTSDLTATPTSTSDDAGADSAGSSHGMSDAETTAAIAVPVIVGSLLIIAALVWFFLRRRRRRQRDSLPSYAPSPGQTPVVSTAKLTDAPPVVPVPAQEPPSAAVPRLPLLDAPETSTSGDDRSPVGSAGQTSARSAHVDDHEVGLAVSGPVHQRQATTEQDQHRESRAASLADTMAQPVRLPFQNTADDDDAVSVVSGMNEGRGRERDLDDMSSVSSFDGDEDRDAHTRMNPNGHGPSR